MTETDAIEAVARTIFNSALARAADTGAFDWENFPAIGETDWQRVLVRLKELVIERRPTVTKAEYDEAYELLSARAVH